MVSMPVTTASNYRFFVARFRLRELSVAALSTYLLYLEFEPTTKSRSPSHLLSWSVSSVWRPVTVVEYYAREFALPMCFVPKCSGPRVLVAESSQS